MYYRSRLFGRFHSEVDEFGRNLEPSKTGPTAAVSQIELLCIDYQMFTFQNPYVSAIPLKGLHPILLRAIRALDSTLSGLMDIVDAGLPSVAPSSQRWAERWNPVGIQQRTLNLVGYEKAFMPLQRRRYRRA